MKATNNVLWLLLGFAITAVDGGELCWAVPRAPARSGKSTSYAAVGIKGRLRGGSDSNSFKMSQSLKTTLLWIPKSKAFTFEDLVWWAGKEPGQPFEEVASRITTIVFGPHASAAFPAELEDFIAPTLTHRKQHDFSDVITGPVGRAWAAAGKYACAPM